MYSRCLKWIGGEIVGAIGARGRGEERERVGRVVVANLMEQFG